MKMKHIVIISPCFQKHANTFLLANAIAKGVNNCAFRNITCSIHSMTELTSESEVLLNANGIAIGSPVHLGNPSYEVLEFIEKVL
eukprot:Pgem_evm1s6432